MLKPLSVSTESLAKPQPTTDLAARVFRAMHGYYGALFLSKWANGVVENGVDCGVSDAMKVWAYELRRYDAKTVLEAIGRCKTAHPEYPPSLPQFVALCEAVQPREVFKALPMVGGAVRRAQQGSARKVARTAPAHPAGGRCYRRAGAVVRSHCRRREVRWR